MTRFKKNVVEIFLAIFCLFFIGSLIIHFLPTIIGIYMYSDIRITESNVEKACGDDMWKKVFNEFDYLEISILP